jgi:hypothetical protein
MVGMGFGHVDIYRKMGCLICSPDVVQTDGQAREICCQVHTINFQEHTLGDK